MNRNQRLGLVVAVVVIAVVAFVIAKPGGDDDKTTSTQAGGTSTTTTGGGTTEKETTAKGPPVTRIAIKGTEVQGGVKTITVKKGDAVRIVVTSDKPNTLHLHGFDIEKQAAPGKPARFAFKANIEGEFELESHTFEDAGMEAGLAKLRVGPA